MKNQTKLWIGNSLLAFAIAFSSAFLSNGGEITIKILIVSLMTGILVCCSTMKKYLEEEEQIIAVKPKSKEKFSCPSLQKNKLGAFLFI